MKLLPAVYIAISLIVLSSPAPRADAGTAPNGAADPIDAMIGDGGFNRVYPVVPGNGIDHDVQITRSLARLELLLRQRNVQSWPLGLRAERARNLDRLHEYRLRAIYPRNYDHPDRLLPCFIDRNGAICAVGYLIEMSAGRAAAERINARYQYATVAAMNDPDIYNWIARSGLTRAEVEAIQRPEMGVRDGRFNAPSSINAQIAMATFSDTTFRRRTAPADSTKSVAIAPASPSINQHSTTGDQR